VLLKNITKYDFRLLKKSKFEIDSVVKLSPENAYHRTAVRFSNNDKKLKKIFLKTNVKEKKFEKPITKKKKKLFKKLKKDTFVLFTVFQKIEN